MFITYFLATIAALLIPIGIAFQIFRPKMDKRVAHLAKFAWKVAGEINDLELKGSCPVVVLKKEPEDNARGMYKSRSIFGWVYFDFIWVVYNLSYLWRVLVHEMTHALRKRHGLPVSEQICREAGAIAVEKYSKTLASELKKR